MNDITLVATELDPNKKYLVTPKEKLNPEMAKQLFELLRAGGFHGVFIGIPMDIIPMDQINGVIDER